MAELLGYTISVVLFTAVLFVAAVYRAATVEQASRRASAPTAQALVFEPRAKKAPRPQIDRAA